jgi:hypothetical protein
MFDEIIYNHKMRQQEIVTFYEVRRRGRGKIYSFPSQSDERERNKFIYNNYFLEKIYWSGFHDLILNFSEVFKGNIDTQCHFKRGHFYFGNMGDISILA